MTRNLRAAFAAVALLAAATSLSAVVTLTERTEVNLSRSGSCYPAAGQCTHPSWDACMNAARDYAKSDQRTSGQVVYRCQTERRVVIASYAPNPPPPTCPPPPVSSTRTQQCPSGSTGTWTQTSTSTVGPPPACTVSTTWAPSSPPAGACTTPPPPPPPPPPPTGDTITHGQAVRIAGGGFGTKAKAAPFVFDTFDVGTGSPGGKTATAGKWTSCPDWSGGVTYSTHDGRKVARHAFGGGTYNASLCADTVTSTFYLDVWVKGVARSNPSRNWKVWRTYDASGNSENGDLVYYCNGGGVSLGGHTWLPEGPPPLGTWIHYQVISTPGLTQHWRNGKLDHERRAASGKTVGQQIGQLRLGHYWGLDGVDECSSNPGGDVYTEDAYFDTSVARVLLADAPTFGTAKVTAIQLPTAWADGEVQFNADTSRFKAGDTVYSIVFTASNAERAGARYTVR